MAKGWIGKIAWALVGLVAAGLVVWAFLPSPVEVDVATVVRGAFRKTIDEDGKTRVRERYVVSAPLAGRLLRVELKPGDRVEEGSLLAALMPSAPTLFDARTERELAERLGAAEAEQLRAGAAVERARVALEQANANLARAAQLAAQGFTSKESLERVQRELELKQKELKLAQFEEHVAQHQTALARAAQSRVRQDGGSAGGQRWEIRSPVAGQVLRVMQESEAMVPVGAPILELGDPHNLEVVIDVLTADATAIRPGAEVDLDHGGNAHPIAGRVRLVEPAAFTKVSALGVEEQRVNVVIDFVAAPADWQNLGDAHRIDGRIVVEKRSDALTVPIGALFRRDAAWSVFVVDGARAKLRGVQVGPRGGQLAVVDGGLEPGERVVVYPSDAVREGVRVRVREEGSR